VPTGTYTYTTTPVTTIYATTPRDLGTFTDIVVVSSTRTIQTLTTTATECACTETKMYALRTTRKFISIANVPFAAP
jgi:hypothetical protein